MNTSGIWKNEKMETLLAMLTHVLCYNIVSYSSANAYMLMYRQIRTDKAVFMNKNELPKHVQKLVARMQDDELKEKKMKDFKKSICKVSLSFQ